MSSGSATFRDHIDALRRSPAGEDWVVVAPAAPQLLAARLHEALRTLD